MLNTFYGTSLNSASLEMAAEVVRLGTVSTESESLLPTSSRVSAAAPQSTDSTPDPEPTYYSTITSDSPSFTFAPVFLLFLLLLLPLPFMILVLFLVIQLLLFLLQLVLLLLQVLFIFFSRLACSDLHLLSSIGRRWPALRTHT